MLLSIMALTCLNTIHQANAQTKPKAATTAAKAITIMGTVSADEKSLVSDEDKKSWTVAKPEALKGHAGHHVSITAQVDAAKDEVAVKSVKMLTANAAKAPKTLENNDDQLRVPPPPRRPSQAPRTRKTARNSPWGPSKGPMLRTCGRVRTAISHNFPISTIHGKLLDLPVRVRRNRGRLPSSRCIESAQTRHARALPLPPRASDTALRLIRHNASRRV